MKRGKIQGSTMRLFLIISFPPKTFPTYYFTLYRCNLFSGGFLALAIAPEKRVGNSHVGFAIRTISCSTVAHKQCF